ncbi:hypothetical protein H8D59_00905 [bacterium]|nr:hypothetical protein [bacterium]MBL7052391.1 hypothetical protein [Candidatus Neomarinimicrobiota bacterium]
MRTVYLLMISVLSFAASGGDFIAEFYCIPDGNEIRVTFKSTSETNVENFTIQRSVNEINFYNIESFIPKGTGTIYSFRDFPFQKSAATSTIYHYRICIAFDNGAEELFTDVVAVQSSVSGLARTWGTIKAMFR